MAVTQTVADTKGISAVSLLDGDGYSYEQFASWRWYTGTGSPNAIITAPKGSLYTEIGSGVLYINTSGTTTWVVVGTQT